VLLNNKMKINKIIKLISLLIGLAIYCMFYGAGCYFLGGIKGLIAGASIILVGGFILGLYFGNKYLNKK